MKIPGLSKIATFALKLAVRSIAKAAADPANPLTIATAKKALTDAVEEEALRAVVKRAI